ncbi:MAG: C40 family peptidase [candidate division Zixibacteria bacterium]|nr:C40 family peptidase [candidate division Zixibacteria bacterium]
MKYAFVTTNLLDLWAEPRFNSERLNQLFFGQPVQVGGRRKGYCRVVSLRDDYGGWADERFLCPITKTAALAYQRGCTSVITKSSARLSDPRGNTCIAPHLVYYGTPVHIKSRRGTLVRAELPDGSLIGLKSSTVKSIHSIKQKSDVSGRRVIAEARRLLGTPYLWGGVSSPGCDCSGLVQTVFGVLGIALPRDTKDQIACGRPIAREETRAGDLLFFKRHVGIALGSHRIIHSSVGGGGVRENSLSADGADYRADLDHAFAEARRIL